jgi:hypothetical protein
MRYRALVVGVVLLAATSLPAASQIKVDMNKITCGDWLGPDGPGFRKIFHERLLQRGSEQ